MPSQENLGRDANDRLLDSERRASVAIIKLNQRSFSVVFISLSESFTQKTNRPDTDARRTRTHQRAIGNGPRNSEPRLRDEDDTYTGTPSSTVGL
ncbi:hypothetical protein TNCV_992481 [Trichonephila clavipes]|nr:hypothetical protein TNCV_992481 [Trichonephila clavipes]